MNFDNQLTVSIMDSLIKPYYHMHHYTGNHRDQPTDYIETIVDDRYDEWDIGYAAIKGLEASLKEKLEPHITPAERGLMLEISELEELQSRLTKNSGESHYSSFGVGLFFVQSGDGGGHNRNERYLDLELQIERLKMELERLPHATFELQPRIYANDPRMSHDLRLKIAMGLWITPLK